MRIIMYDGHARRDSEPLIAHVAAHLGKFGIDVERVRVRKAPLKPWESYAALVANGEFPNELRAHLDCFGKTSSDMPSRALTLEWLAEAGLPMMRWSRAKDGQALEGLFDAWQTDAILLKRSDTYGGTSVALFTREHAGDVQWDPDRDIFCPEVNRDDGDIYKIEMFGQELLLGWMSRAPTARSRMEGGSLTGIYGAYGQREPFDWQDSLLEPARRFGAFALEQGYGHISLDLMRNPQGGYEVIEVNLGNVAIWWTSQYRSFRDAYARAVYRMLAERQGAPEVQIGAGARFRRGLLALPGIPKLLLREIQGALWRKKNSREQALKYGGVSVGGKD